MKIRTIITQDAEVDDQNSLRHFLFYANEVELQGIVQTSSKFHWRGVPGKVKPEKQKKDDFDFGGDNGPYDAPYRWTGTDWMWRVLDDYEKDYPNLSRHAEGYPTPETLRSVTKIGNVGYEGEMDAPSEGSELIRARMLDEDERLLYIQVWGGCNTIARALLDIESEWGGRPEWPALHDKLTKKIILTACGEQDPAYREVIAERWPGIQFVKTLQMQSYAYPWFVMPEGESKDTLRAAFMKREILNGKSALASGYCTWLDGKRYEGEGEDAQFGANPNIGKEWFGAKMMGLPEPKRYDFLSEGDSPTYFALFNWGFRTLEDFRYGGVAGRYARVEGETNSRGEALNIWDVCRDSYTDCAGQVHLVESMWPYVADIQRDFAARVAWAGTDDPAQADHAPTLNIREGLDLTAAAGASVALHAVAESRDGDEVEVSFRLYPEASAACAAEATLAVSGAEALLTLPAEAAPGDAFHVIVKAQATGRHRLVCYRQVIVSAV